MNIGVYTPKPDDGTSLVRALMPFAMLARERPALRIIPCPFNGREHNHDWTWLAQCDVVVYHRPFLPQHVNAIATARILGIPVWLDYDDDLTSVTPANPMYGLYGNDQVGVNIGKMVEMANVVSVTTKHLGQRLNAGDKLRVIPNAWNDYVHNFEWLPRNRTVLWRGSAAHDETLQAIRPAIQNVAQDPKYHAWSWAILGDAPWWFTEVIPRQKLVTGGFQNPFIYFHTARMLAPAVMLCPSKSTVFNRSRSNLAWLEGTTFGAAVLGPDLEEWRRPGVTNYKDTADFEKQLRGLLERWQPNKAVYPEVETSREFIEGNLKLSQVNEMRWEILRELRLEGGTQELKNEEAEA